MNENENAMQESAAETVTTEAAAPADQQDAFLSEFLDDGDTVTVEDDTPAQETDTADQPTADEGEGSGADEGDGTPADKPEQQSEKPPVASWDIKHLGERQTIQADDPRVPELLQKGIDYERIRASRDDLQRQLDETRPAATLIADLAKQANMSVEDFARSIRVEAKKSQGMTEEEARRAIDLETREAAVAAAENAARQAQSEREQNARRVQADIADFSKAFPDVYAKAKADPKAIPQSVWDAVNGGLSLTAAYARHAAAEAEARAKEAESRAATAVQNAQNAARTTGSQRSAGADARDTDAFLSEFLRD